MALYCMADGMVDPLATYVYLARHVGLPLAALRRITERSSPQDVVASDMEGFKGFLKHLHKDGAITGKVAEKAIARHSPADARGAIQRIHDSLARGKHQGVSCLSFFDPRYPDVLRGVSSPPKFVFMKGEITPADKRAVAIVGTRMPSPHGRDMATGIASRLAELGFTVVSGLARGIDGIAMRSALDRGGRVIGVLGSGILNLYPKEHGELASDIARSGALISEVFPEESVNVRALQIRNRLTSGLGLANIIVEGTEKSGTKWQLKYGKEQGKPAIAVRPVDGTIAQAFIPNHIMLDPASPVITEVADVDAVMEQVMRRRVARASKQLTLPHLFGEN